MSRQTLQEFCTTQKRPELLVEWDLERNAPLTPKDVTFGSHKKVWWCCKNGHSWQTAVYTRSGGAGCPYCSGRLPHIERSKVLSQYAPALVKEWDSEKNAPLTPSQVTVGSHRVVWWRCRKATITRHLSNCACAAPAVLIALDERSCRRKTLWRPLLRSCYQNGTWKKTHR